MPEKKKLPVGIDNFEKIIKNNFYYVDKTEMIHSLIQNWSEVNLITRPRRFGKTLNMNMLQTFFEIGTDPTVFDGLKISEVIIPGLSEPPVRTLRATIPENGSHIFR